MSGPVLVLGATGQIGRNILNRTRGNPVLALARRPAEIDSAPGRSAHGLTDISDLDGSLPEQAIATIPIWLLPPLVDQLTKRGLRRLVCFGTTSIDGKSESRNRYEREVVTRIKAVERELPNLAARADVALTVLRSTLIYGEGEDRTVTSAARFIRRFGFYPVYREATGKRQPVHADDLAAGALLALENDETVGRTYALGGGETLTYRDMIARIFAVLGRPERIVSVSMLPALLSVAGTLLPGSELSGDVAHRMNIDLDFDDGSAGRDFGYAPRPFLSAGLDDLSRSSVQS